MNATKRCLKKQLVNTWLTYEELVTVLVDVDGVINSLLLTYVYAEDVEDPLTPAYLLNGRGLLTLPDTHDQQCSDVPGSTQETIIRRAWYQRTLADNFWGR